jgi:hypothetical protein
MPKKQKPEKLLFERGRNYTPLREAVHCACAGFASYPFMDLLPENLSESIFHLAGLGCIVESAINRNCRAKNKKGFLNRSSRRQRYDRFE